MTPSQAELLSKLQQRPAVHLLCQGAYLQGPEEIEPHLFAIPLKSLGFQAQANYVGIYTKEIAGFEVNLEAFNSLLEQGKEAIPICALVFFLRNDDLPQRMEDLAMPSLERARQVVSWISGDEISSFALVTCTTIQSYFRLIFPHSRRRQRLGFGNTGLDLKFQIQSILRTAESDEQFAYALSLLHDANSERNPRFKIARLYNCLECLAYKVKGQHEGKSRRAVKAMLGLPDGATVEIQIDEEKYRFDVIEIAGRLRDKLFHGLEFRVSDLLADQQRVFQLLEGKHPANPSGMMSFE